jgi:pimeloyl-ACP methyl ester carboxylesterase
VPTLELGGQRLEYDLIETGEDAGLTLVFLHEGLGSVAMWKDFPRDVSQATGCKALVYSRVGYGQSTALAGGREPDFMHQEALVVLPEVLEKLGIENPILLGHSDGASIALIHAGGARRPVAGLILMAPHVIVESICVQSISAVKMTYETALKEKLRRYHADPDGAFWGWCDIWLDPRFLAWNIEEYVRNVSCPVLAIQGFDDEFGTMRQIDRIKILLRRTDLLKLKNCGHSPHRDHADVVINAVCQFVKAHKIQEENTASRERRPPDFNSEAI